MTNGIGVFKPLWKLQIGDDASAVKAEKYVL